MGPSPINDMVNWTKIIDVSCVTAQITSMVYVFTPVEQLHRDHIDLYIELLKNATVFFVGVGGLFLQYILHHEKVHRFFKTLFK